MYFDQYVLVALICDRPARLDAGPIEQIYVTFRITEGPQTVVENLALQGNTRISGLELTPKSGFRLRPGQPFSPKG